MLICNCRSLVRVALRMHCVCRAKNPPYAHTTPVLASQASRALTIGVIRYSDAAIVHFSGERGSGHNRGWDKDVSR